MVDFTSHFYVQYSNEQEMYNAVLNFGEFPRAGSSPTPLPSRNWRDLWASFFFQRDLTEVTDGTDSKTKLLSSNRIQTCLFPGLGG